MPVIEILAAGLAVALALDSAYHLLAWRARDRRRRVERAHELRRRRALTWTHTYPSPFVLAMRRLNLAFREMGRHFAVTLTPTMRNLAAELAKLEEPS